MATDATGTPTPLGIPTYNVNVDAPSGNGFNAAMAVIDTLIQARAALVSPTFTGTPAAPTPATADNSTKIATTAFVKAQGYVTSQPVTQVFGRTGAVVANTGDYTAAQVTNAADKNSASVQAFNATVLAPAYYSDAGSVSASFGGTMNPDFHQGQWWTVVNTGNGTVTISSPANPPNTSQTGQIFIKIRSAVGTTTTVSWGAAFSFTAIAAPTSVGSGGSVKVMFEWDPDASVWTAVAFA